MKKGDCFMAAWYVVCSPGTEQRRRAEELLGPMAAQLDDARVVHGKPMGQGPLAGRRIDHAWVEVSDLVIDVSNGHDILLPRDAYYRVGQIEATDVVRYTRADALRVSMRLGHFGPWV